ncbi:retrotransposon protein, putative, ty1-copia subclass [Tanacetum coccineum]
MLQDVKSYCGRSFAMKYLGDAAYILGIKIYSDRSKRLIGLCQSAYIEKILKIYYMENSKRGTIPMQEKLKLSKSQGASTPAEKQRMQNVPYASAIGSIMYAMRSFDASKEAVWIRKFISGLGIVPTIEEPISDVKIEKVDTDDNLADPFIKALEFPKHSDLTRNIGMLPASSFM